MHLSRPKRSVGPIYTFAVVWLVLSLILPMYKLAGLIAVAGISLAAGIAVGAALSKKQKRDEPAPEPKPEPEPEKSYGPTVDPIVADGKRAIAEMGRLYSSINL